ncbi:MAG: phosphate acyltransferase PlsX [Calditrichia bacterium]
MRIALDAMGGDFAPKNPVQGALDFVKQTRGQHDVVLIGDRDLIQKELDAHHFVKDDYLKHIEIVHTTQVVEMHDAPASIVKSKPDSSMVVGLQMHKRGEVDAFVSAGSTGAQMAASLLVLGRIKGVLRPALGSFLPAENGVTLLIDVGANAECKPEFLLQFGIMGSIYCNYIYNVENPRVALLNIGEEETKGSELYQQSHQLMKNQMPHFVGNVEGRDILRGKADVVVCDGFTGNVVLKFAESVMGVVFKSLKEHIGTNMFSMLGAFLLKHAFKNMKKNFNYEEYGGVPLLGVSGTSIICHGSSSPRALMNACHVAVKMVEKRVNEHIQENIK